MREVTTIELKKTTRQDIDSNIMQLQKSDVRTPDAYINHIIKRMAQLDNEIAALQRELTYKNDLINKISTERDNAQAHIFEQYQGEIRTVPASGKLSLEKHAGKKVRVAVVE